MQSPGDPIPVVSTCSRCSTAWIRDTVSTARPAVRCRAARAAPARMLLVPASSKGALKWLHSNPPNFPFLLIKWRARQERWWDSAYQGQSHGAAQTRCAARSHPRRLATAGPSVGVRHMGSRYQHTRRPPSAGPLWGDSAGHLVSRDRNRCVSSYPASQPSHVWYLNVPHTITSSATEGTLGPPTPDQGTHSTPICRVVLGDSSR